MYGVAVAVDAKRNAADTACSIAGPTIVLARENAQEKEKLIALYCGTKWIQS